MGRPKTYNRDEALLRAMNLFWRNGFASTHMTDLVESIGLDRFSLYKEFSNKDGLFQAALERYPDQARMTYMRHLCAWPLGLENIRRYFFSIKFPTDCSGCFMIDTLSERHSIEQGGRLMELSVNRDCGRDCASLLLGLPTKPAP